MTGKTILIADAGSTKVEWASLAADGTVVKRHTSGGINALLAEAEDVASAFREVREELGGTGTFSEIHYYGAGCATERVCTRMKELIGEVWTSPEIHVESDLLGASRALFGDKPGIACILGTGSNSCLYDGQKIANNVPSLGYVLGDEGSGAALGKRLVSDAFKRRVPDKICNDFLSEYGLTLESILDSVYRSPAPNRFLASLVPFISKTLWNPYIYSIVLEEFKRFITRNVAAYEGAHSLPVSFVGGIACGFEEILRKAASSQGFEVFQVMKAPMEGLISYHASH